MKKPTKLTPRRLARSFALQGLYYHQINFKTISEIEDFLYTNDSELYLKANYELMHNLLELCSNHFAEYLNCYFEFSSRNLADINKVEQIILVIAAAELKNNLSVPAQVIINEAVELSKSFGSEEGYRFINTLVDKLAHKLRAIEFNQ